MPMIDLTYPQGALDPDARAEAVEKLTAALLRNEGATDNDATRAMSWTVVHELPPEAINVGGSPAERPVYRLMITVPAGTLLQGPGPVGMQSRRNLVRDATEILLAAEGTEFSEVEAGRVFCIVREVEDGYWGGMAELFRMDDIVATANREAPQTAVSERARGAVEQLTAERSGAAV
jgi:phenylpyruvate tautomerase PptA (4-oxalocrotonate tautomerase family)